MEQEQNNEKLFKCCCGGCGGACCARVPDMPTRRVALKNALQKRIVAAPSPYAFFLRVAAPALLVALVFVIGGREWFAGRAVVSFLSDSARAVEQMPPEERARVALALGADPAELIAAARAAKDASFGQIVAEESAADAVSMNLAASEPAPEAASAPRLMKAAPVADAPVAPVVDDGGAGAAPTMMMAAFAAPEPAPLPPPVSFVSFTDSFGSLVVIGFSETGVPVSVEYR